jgi:hypothetical protein
LLKLNIFTFLYIKLFTLLKYLDIAQKRGVIKIS